MRVRKLKVGKPYLIVWQDAASYEQKVWFSKQDIESQEASIVHSLGFYTHASSKSYHFVACCQPDSHDHDDTMSRHIEIPIGMVQSIKELS